MDRAPSDDERELRRLEEEIVRETVAIDDLRNRTRVMRIEVAGWKAPGVPREDANFDATWAGFMFGIVAVAGVGKVIALVLGR